MFNCNVSLGSLEFLDMYLHEAGSKQGFGLHSDHEEGYSCHGYWGKKYYKDLLTDFILTVTVDRKSY